jgi:F-type H+-transporting ATPase subunit epsilon
MTTPFQLDIVLPETPMPPRNVVAIDVPSAAGRLTILAHHQPLLAALLPGSMTITDAQDQKETWSISGGALQVENNVATLLVQEASPVP